MKSIHYTCIKIMLALSLFLFLFGCSGSSNDTTSSTTPVSGIVLAGPANGASVTVKSVAGVIIAGPVTTDSNGAYTISIPNSTLSGELIFEAAGGTFPDEATSSTGVTFGTLSAHIAANSLTSGSTIALDPSSTIVQKLVAAGVARSAADSSFSAAFGYTPNCSVKPAFATISSASNSTQRLAGLRTAAFSQLTKDLGLAPADQFKLIIALVDDLKDGTLDGVGVGGAAISFTTAAGTTFTIPTDIANRFSSALVTFLSSAQNKSKLGIDQLGNTSFAKTALTASYKVEYIPGTKAATQGKTSFQIKITNLSDKTPATGLASSITLIPKMHMATMTHSAPVDVVSESATPGTYDCTVYYLMASGVGMGVWELKVKIGSESVIYYPPVAMSMGSTTRTTLKGVSDVIGSMMGMGTTPRTYYIFNDSLTGMGPYTFKMFIAALDDSMMMKFPAVSTGAILHDQMNAAWSVNGSTSNVQVSSDSGATWVTATDNGNGHWSAAGLSGLASGGTIRVKLNINGEQKLTSDTTPLDYSSFTIVSGM